MTSSAGLPDLLNLRDVGGPATADGRHVRTGVLYRSATPYFLDDDQVAVLQSRLGIRTRIDLRSEHELATGTNDRLAGVASRHLPLRAGPSPWSGGDGVAEVASRHYLGYLAGSVDTLTTLVRTLAEDDRLPALVHCTAGKDRTGVAVALVLATLGVADDEIVTDYARSHDDLAAVLRQMGTLAAYGDRLAKFPAEALTAEAGSMVRFLERLRDRHGSARAWFLAHGVSAGTLGRLEDRLLEDRPPPSRGRAALRR